MRKSTACSIATEIVAMIALGGTSPAGAGLLPVNADAMRSADADQITDAHSNDGGNALFAGAALGSIGPGVVDYYHPYYRRHYYRATIIHATVITIITAIIITIATTTIHSSTIIIVITIIHTTIIRTTTILAITGRSGGFISGSGGSAC